MEIAHMELLRLQDRGWFFWQNHFSFSDVWFTKKENGFTLWRAKPSLSPSCTQPRGEAAPVFLPKMLLNFYHCKCLSIFLFFFTESVLIFSIWAASDEEDDDVKYLVPSVRPAANFCVGREIDGTVAAPAVNTLKISYTSEYWAIYPTDVYARHNI